MIDLRKVRDPDKPEMPRRYLAGQYEAYIMLPGRGQVLFGHVARTGRPGVDHYPWEWWVDVEFDLPAATLPGKPLGHTETKRSAVEKLALLAKAVKEVLDPPEPSELDGWVDDTNDAPVDAEALTRAALVLGELFDVWLVDGQQGTLEEKVRLYATLRDLSKRDGRIDSVLHDLKVDLKETLTVAEVDGRIWKAKRVNRRTGFDKQAIRSKVNSAALAPILDVDPETGEVLSSREPHPAEAIDKVWKAADVATGRTKVLREEFGIDLDEYAASNWSTDIVELTEADLKPEELAALRGEEVPES